MSKKIIKEPYYKQMGNTPIPAGPQPCKICTQPTDKFRSTEPKIRGGYWQCQTCWEKDTEENQRMLNSPEFLEAMARLDNIFNDRIAGRQP